MLLLKSVKIFIYCFQKVNPAEKLVLSKSELKVLTWKELAFLYIHKCRIWPIYGISLWKHSLNKKKILWKKSNNNTTRNSSVLLHSHCLIHLLTPQMPSTSGCVRIKTQCLLHTATTYRRESFKVTENPLQHIPPSLPFHLGTHCPTSSGAAGHSARTGPHHCSVEGQCAGEVPYKT